jgi:hypothetical protein
MYLKIGKTVLQIMALAKKQKDSIPGFYYGFSKALGFCSYLKTHSRKLTFFGGGVAKRFLFLFIGLELHCGDTPRPKFSCILKPCLVGAL